MHSERTIITGDSYRDYKKYLEIQKMNNHSSTLNNNSFSNTLRRPTNSPSINRQYAQTSRRLYRPQSTSDISTNNFNHQIDEKNSSFKKVADMTFPEINAQNINNNYNSLYNISNNNSKIKEFDKLKILFGKNLQNQNEMQNKIIDYNKIISSQDNIIRLNNIKLNEHDHKLTEILVSFNNFLQFNEKSAMIISDIQKKMENFVKFEDFSNLKNIVTTLIKNNEIKLNEIDNNIEDIKLNVIENKKEHDTYQKYSLEKITTIQNDFLNNKLEQQNELIKFQDTRSESYKIQFEQIKSQIKTNENFINDEIDKRKNMINELREEILTIFNKKDEQIGNLEKSQLINEENMMKLNREFVQTLNELINKSNQKHDYEIKAVRSLIEATIEKNEHNLNKMIGEEKEKISILENNFKDFENKFNTLDNFARESINDLEEKYEVLKDEHNVFKTKLEMFNDTLLKYMNDNIEVLNHKIKKAEEELNHLLEEEAKKNSDKIQTISEFTERHAKDCNEKLSDFSQQIYSLLENYKRFKKITDDTSLTGADNPNMIVIKEIIYNTCNEILQPVKQNFNEYNQELRNELNEKIDNNKKLYSLEQVDNLKKVGEMLDKKIALIKNELENEMNKNKNMIDGMINSYVVESELHIKEKYDKDIDEIKKEINEINTKIIAGS